MIPATGPETGELDPHRIDSRRDIIALLRSLALRRQLLHMNFNGNAESLVTAILAVRESEGSLIVSGSFASTENLRIAGGGPIEFETVLDRVRVMFSVDRAEICEYQNHPALRTALPASLIRLQRRENFRVSIPVAAPVRCTIRIPHESGRDADSVSLALSNVSGGGIALIDEAVTMDDTVGRIYKNCQIDLPGVSRIVTSLQIRNSRTVRLPNGQTIRRLGCLFLDLPGPMLAAVQRYVRELEVKQNAKSRGL